MTHMLKMDENNQYSRSMTKPLPYSWIKKQEHPPSLTELNRILDKISHDDNIWHLFIVNIKFNYINPKTLLFNEIYLAIWCLSDSNGTQTQNHLVRKQTLNHLPNLTKLKHFAKWLSVRLWAKLFWVLVQLQSLKLQVSHLLREKSSLTFRQL